MAEYEPVTDNDPCNRASVRSSSGIIAVLLAAVTLANEPLLCQSKAPSVLAQARVIVAMLMRRAFQGVGMYE
jgi:hypothetical protein